jgi:hypothetical protein
MGARPLRDDAGVHFLEGAGVLASIEDAVRSGRRVTAAVAYVGPDAADALPWGGGDLICGQRQR